jgi:hypothetical protein
MPKIASDRTNGRRARGAANGRRWGKPVAANGRSEVPDAVLAEDDPPAFRTRRGSEEA